MERNFEKMLTEAGLRPSPAKILVARVLSESSRPLSALELETELDTLDRSSITRTLVAFQNKGLVHSIHDGSGATRYEICNNPGNGGQNDGHPHFYCRKCGTTFCLSDLPLPQVETPPGYITDETLVVIRGICPLCHAKTQTK